MTPAEAATRLRTAGPNRFEAIRPTSLLTILARQFQSVLVLLLAVAAVISLLTHDISDALAILAVLVLNAGIGFATEWHARRAMEGLLALDVARAWALRGSHLVEIPSSELVPGDVIELEAGRQVPADARLLEAVDLEIVEAPLTGESLPAHKDAAAKLNTATPIAERCTMAYKGTTVAAGRGRAIVVATGMGTEVGRIGVLAGSLDDERTPLERQLEALGRPLLVITLAAAALTGLFSWMQGIPIGAVVQTAIALAVAAIPEGLPAVATITLALGVRRMARRHALIRRLPAVEALGSTTVICTDKTGTLTAGTMAVTTIALQGADITLTCGGRETDGAFLHDGVPVEPATNTRLIDALRIGVLASRADGVWQDGAFEGVGDPMDVALLAAASRADLDPATLRHEWPAAGEIGFTSARMFMASLHAAPDGLFACVKGAPDRVLDRCTRVRTSTGIMDLSAAMRAELHDRNVAFAAGGARLLALAEGPVRHAREEALADLTFVAFAVFDDPVAPGVPETIARCRLAGIRTLMLTGDQRATAESIAAKVGLLSPGTAIVDGPVLDAMPDAELAVLLPRIGGVSRVSPEGKLRLVAALQARGEIVAMLGDGVNDAAALRKADVGVAMGLRGSDLAKEAADVVLTDDRLATVSAAVEEGRTIHDNVRKSVLYLLGCNLAEIAVVLGAVVVGIPLPLLPLQILWLNLVTDTAPALALALEPGEPDLMRRPPRRPGERLLRWADSGALATSAALIAGVTLLAFVHGQHRGDLAHARTLAFLTLGLAQLFHLGNARSRAHVLSPTAALANRAALAAVIGMGTLHLAAVLWPPLATLLGASVLGWTDLLVACGLAAAPAVLVQLARLRIR